MRKVFFFFSFFSILLASNITSLLNKIEKIDDLSRKTRMESSGISYVITRYQLDMMQAKTLSDVLDNTVIGYLESRYGIVDPWSIGILPYNSVGVRVFIDNQELTSGEYDNTLYLLSKIDLSFVDHIEIYYMSPSYALSNEPSYIVIKLYSKDAKRDEGKRVAFSYGTFKSNSEVADYAKPGNYSLYLHLSRLEWNHKKYKVKSSTLSRDSITKHFLLSIYNDTTRYLLTAIDYDQDAFLGLSLDGNIKISNIHSKFVHFGVDTKWDDFVFKYFIDYGNDKSSFEENDNGFLMFTQKSGFIKKVHTHDWTLTNSFNGYYKKQFNKNDFLIGAGYRNKRIDFNHIYINDKSIPYEGPKNENIFTEYVENNYQISSNNVITTGISFFQYFTKPENKFLKQYKIGNTHLFDKNTVFKLFYHHMEYMNANYLVSTILPATDNRPKVSNVLIAKLKKILGNDTLEINGLYSYNKNLIIPSTSGSMEIYKKNIPIKILDFRYHHNYNSINDMIIEVARMFFERLRLKRNDYIIFINTHRISKFQLLENFVYRKEVFTESVKDGLNVNLALKYDVNDNLSLGVKAYNVLNTRYKNSYFIYNFQNNTFNYLSLPLYERSVMFSMEYTF